MDKTDLDFKIRHLKALIKEWRKNADLASKSYLESDRMNLEIHYNIWQLATDKVSELEYQLLELEIKNELN